MMEDRLGRALGAWSARGRVDDRERDRMRTAILLTPEVDALWWDQFNQQMARVRVRAQLPLTDDAAARISGRVDQPRMGWGAAAELR